MNVFLQKKLSREKNELNEQNDEKLIMQFARVLINKDGKIIT